MTPLCKIEVTPGMGDQAIAPARGDPAARSKGPGLYQSPLPPCGVVDEVERTKNRTKSKVRARVEHSIGILKRVFGFAKVPYRGLKKNTHRLLVTCALANLFVARRHLLRCARA